MNTLLRVEVTKTDISGVVVLSPQVFGDERGFFFESFNQARFAEATGVKPVFLQDNHSNSAKGVLRGLHYQVPPYAQGKLVRCGNGRVWDVAVDIRKSSPTFGRWFGLELSADNRKQMWLPEGMAHGFVALTDGAELLYKTTDYYAPEYDRSIRWDDPEIGIEWPIDVEPILSNKDRGAPCLADADLFP